MSADILKALSARAQAALSGDLDGVRDHRVKRILMTLSVRVQDARLAGLHVLRLLNEPTAAAIAYGWIQVRKVILPFMI